MHNRPHNPQRRALSALLGLGTVATFSPMSAALALSTPRQSRGPFYPIEFPVDSDSDLVHVEGNREIAAGEITHLTGTIQDERGRLIQDARIEIWQCDANGRYRHPRDARDVPRDPHFQGYGRARTNADGVYRFRTIKPVAYPGRAPHIHFAIHGPGFEPLVTQMYVKGAPENEWDWILNSIHDSRARESLIVAFTRDSPSQPYTARFNIILAADGRSAHLG